MPKKDYHIPSLKGDISINELLGTDIDSLLTLEEENNKKVQTLLDMKHREVVTELNSAYLLTGKYPKMAELKKRVDLTQFAAVGLKNIFKKVNKTLETRDLPPFKVSVKPEPYDPLFIAAVGLLTNVTDKRSVSVKLKSIKVTPARWNNWLKLQKNRTFYETAVNKIMDFEVYNEGRVALARNVVEGDLPSIKYYNEMAGKFIQQRDFDPRIIGVMITTILDIITSHVDSNTARIIADEIDQKAIGQLTKGVIDV